MNNIIVNILFIIFIVGGSVSALFGIPLIEADPYPIELERRQQYKFESRIASISFLIGLASIILSILIAKQYIHIPKFF